MNKKVFMIKKGKAILYFLLTTIISICIGAVLNHFVWPDIMDTMEVKMFGKTEIIVNINEINPLEEGQLENFSLMFGTQNGIGMLVAVQKGHPDLDKIFNDVFIPYDLDKNSNNPVYFIGILNNGNREARDLRVTFTGDTLKIERIDFDKKIDFVNCGGSGSQSICDIKENELAPNEKISLLVKARTPSIANVNISAKGNFESFVNFKHYFAKTIVEGELFQLYLDNNKVAELPPLNQNPNFLQYYYSPQENRWISM
jgi:hypothetical protein